MIPLKAGDTKNKRPVLPCFALCVVCLGKERRFLTAKTFRAVLDVYGGKYPMLLLDELVAVTACTKQAIT